MAARRRGRTRLPGGPGSGRPAATRSAPTDVPPPSGPGWNPEAPTSSARTDRGLTARQPHGGDRMNDRPEAGDAGSRLMTIDADQRRAIIAARLPVHDWPEP